MATPHHEHATIGPARRLHGRLPEVGALWEAFHRAQRGEVVLVLVDGPAGIGKTRLVESLMEPIRIEGGRVSRGSWVRQRTGPLEGLLGALDGVVGGLLSEPEPVQAALRVRLEREVGEGLALLTGLLPELVMLTGPRPPPPAMAPQEAQQRFELLVQRLVRCFAQESSPLVLFLDDLQWAEPSSLRLIGKLVGAAPGPGLLLIGALRSPCEAPCLDPAAVCGALGPCADHALRLPLAPLLRADVQAMVADLLGMEHEESLALAGIAHDVGGGNPWVTQRFLVKLNAFGALSYRDGAWSVDLQGARELAAVGSHPELVDTALAGLPEPTRQVLELAACIGPELDAELLALAAGRDGLELMELLEPALQRGMLERVDGPVVKPDDALPRGWRFAHDRLHGAIYGALRAGEKAALHRRIVRRLRRSWNQTERVAVLYAVVDQLHMLPTQGEKVSTRQARLSLLLEAGRRAVGSAAWETAVRHLEAALGIEPWAGRSTAQDLELRRLLAQALQATGHFVQAGEQLDGAASLAVTLEDRVGLRVQRTNLLVHAARYSEALDQALDGLAELGCRLPHRDRTEDWQALVGQELTRQASLLGGRAVSDLAEGPTMAPGAPALELSLLGAMAPVTYVFPALMPWTISRMVNLCLEHGNGFMAPLAYVFQGLLCAITGEYERGHSFGRLALELERRRPDRRLYGPVIHLYVNFINHWTQPMDTGLELGIRAVNVALQYGQNDYAGWLAMNAILGLFYRGRPLEACFQRCVELFRLVRDTICYDDVTTVTAQVVTVVGRLYGQEQQLRELGLADDGLPQATASLEHYRVARAHVYIVHMIQAVICGDFESARAHADAASPDLHLAGGMEALPEFALYETVLLCHEHTAMAEEARPDALGRMRAHVEALEGWARSCPANHDAKLALATAELAAVEGRAEAAVAAYIQAVEAAADQGFLQVELLACARAFRFHQDQGHGRTAALYRRAALDAGGRWGMAGAALPGALEPGPAQEDAPGGGAAARAQVEPATASRRSFGEDLDPAGLAMRLVEAVLAFAGAQRLGFFAELDGELVHLASTGSGPEPDTERRPIGERPAWPVQLVHQVHRAGQELSSGTPGAPEACLPDIDSIPLPRSWLSLPLKGSDGLRGVLHLEHDGRDGVFEGVECSTLSAMGALALVPLCELERYADLARLSRALEVSSSKLASHSATLQAEVLEWAGDLEALHEEHHSTLEALLDGVVRVDLQGSILYVNPAAVRITGFTTEELVGASGTQLLEPQDLHGFSLATETPRQSLESSAAAPFNALLRRKDGSRVSVEFRWSPVFRPDGSIEGGVIAIRDISRRQQLEQQLRQAQKMEAMGRFAGGMAHDLNNLLTPIRGHLERIRSQAVDDAELQRRSGAAAEAAERATALVKQVLAFSRRAEVFKQPHDLVPIVDDVYQFLVRSMDRAIELRWTPPRGSFWFLGDAGLVQQVLLNLGLNARHALEEAQRQGAVEQPSINIQLSRAGKNGPGSPLPRGLPDPCLVLTVRDNGVGMDEQTQARIFEPFFTTKPPDQGTGLGLSMVYGIVEQHGGCVTVKSEPGAGAEFTCYLPACAPGQRARLAEPAQVPARGVGQTLLVVDDELPVRELAREVLEEFGYRVIEAPNGETALDIHASREVDLVLLDLSMPGISGPETLRRLRARDPSLPVVLWSGYSAEDDLPATVGAEANAFLEKPFMLHALVAVVGEVLGGTGVSS